MSPIPYRQGRLDSLCGIYALINGFAHARRHDPLRYFPTKRLFMTLFARTAKISGDTSFCGDGIDYDEFRKLGEDCLSVSSRRSARFRASTAQGAARYPLPEGDCG